MPAPVLQIRRGNAGVAGTVPALRPGEPAISLNNFDFFIGIDTSVANNKFFGSHRYWGREDGTTSLRLKLVDRNGTNSINLKAPDTLAGIVTYTFPETINAGNYLKVDASGGLSWASVSDGGSFSNATFTNSTLSGITTISGTSLNVTVPTQLSGITTFTNTTDNVLGNPDTGAVQIDGGLGVNKNVTVGAGLSVVGESYFIGTATFYGGQLNLGDSDTDNISVAGEFISNLVPNATNTYDLGLTGKRWRNGFYSGNLDVTGNLVVDGTAIIGGGTTVILYGEDVYIRNKDIILGYTTSITGNDASTDDTANHAGVAIASTVGSPLVSFTASGINTLPDTYKQLMWFQNGTLGFGTDAFAFNYGVAIGTTTMANGVRLAVGSGITMSDNSISATNGYFTNISASNITGSLTGTISTATRALTIDVTENDTSTGSILFAVGTGATAILRDDQLTFNANTNTLTIGSGVGITQFSSSVSTGSSTTSVPTSSAIIDYINTGVNLNIGLAAGTNGSGTGSVSTGSTITFAGTTNEIDVTVAGSTVTYGLPNDVVVGTSLSVPTIKTTTIQSSGGTTAITVAGNDITVADDLTVQGNLYVQGSTTQIDTTTLAIEDRTIELGRITSGTQPTSTTWDLAVLFNYGDSGVKKAGLVWEASGATKRFQFTTDVNPGTDGSDSQSNLPSFTVTNFAPIEIKELWVTDCAGTSQVISCTGTERFLENITLDAGVF